VTVTIAEHIAESLYRKGVRFVYGIPGGPSIPLMEAFRNAGIEFILVSHESAGGIMADISARLTGIPGVCHATSGPGAANLATAAGEALLDRSPLIILTTEMSDRMINRTTQMNIDHQKLFRPVTKASFRMTPENSWHLITDAFRISLAEYTGPVHIGIPSDISSVEALTATALPDEVVTETPDNDEERIREIIKTSSRPVIAAGLTAARHGTGNMLAALLDDHKIPVILTPMAKGLISEDHPCYAGVLFHALSDYLEDIVNDADLLIGLGYDPVEYDYESWITDVPLIHFNTIDADLPERENIFSYTGPPDEWFGLLKNLDMVSGNSDISRVETVRYEVSSVLDGFRDHFGPVTALAVLGEEIPHDAIVTFDVGSHLHLAGQMWRTYGNPNMLITNGWSGMGFGIPAALAAKLIRPSSTAVCVTGDGGFLMMAGELMTARRYNIPVIIVVFSDGELNLIKLKQSWKNLQHYATGLYSADLFESDTFLGIDVITADSEVSLRKAINESLNVSRPVIINARIDPDDYKWLVVRKES